MQVIEVDPSKKYVLLVTREGAEELRELWARFMEGDRQVIFIFGRGVALVPADQVVGCKAFANVTLDDG